MQRPVTALRHVGTWACVAASGSFAPAVCLCCVGERLAHQAAATESLQGTCTLVRCVVTVRADYRARVVGARGPRMARFADTTSSKGDWYATAKKAKLAGTRMHLHRKASLTQRSFCRRLPGLKTADVKTLSTTTLSVHATSAAVTPRSCDDVRQLRLSVGCLCPCSCPCPCHVHCPYRCQHCCHGDGCCLCAWPP